VVKILFLEESVRANVTARFTVRTTVVREHVKSTLSEALDDPYRASTVVGDTVKIDDRASARDVSTATPTLQPRSYSGQSFCAASGFCLPTIGVLEQCDGLGR